MTFKGGTSLSKGWKLIERFSEDINIVIDRGTLGFTEDNVPEHAPSNKQVRKRLDSLKVAAQACVEQTIRPALLSAIKAEMPTSLSWSLEHDSEDPETISHCCSVIPRLFQITRSICGKW